MANELLDLKISLQHNFYVEVIKAFSAKCAGGAELDWCQQREQRGDVVNKGMVCLVHEWE
jgi:hypothetical protein